MVRGEKRSALSPPAGHPFGPEPPAGPAGPQTSATPVDLDRPVTRKSFVDRAVSGYAAPETCECPLTGSPAARHAWNPPIRSVARASPSRRSETAAKLDAYPSLHTTTTRRS